jgi:type IV fimbrial biogenesis protein FimT
MRPVKLAPLRGPARKLSHGITTLELAISLTIIAVASTLAVPGFRNLRQDSLRTTAVNNFIHALYLARSEAIKRGAVVSICKSANGETCLQRSAEWSDGWMVFVNANRDEPPQHDTGEPVLAVYESWAGGRITSNRQSYSFRAYNQAVVNGTLVFCDSRGGPHARAIIISGTGRPRIAQRDASNKPLRCTAAAK